MEIRITTFGTFIFFVLSLNLVQAQGKIDIISDSFSIRSTVLSEKKVIQIIRLQNIKHKGNTVLPQVIYAFDGEYQTYLVASTVLHFIEADSSLPNDWLIVGITHSDRRKDLAPSLTTAPLPPFPMAVFMQKELIPFVDANFPNTGKRWLVGHSYGGLAVIHMFIRYPNLFDGYIASDPSLWWNEQCLLKPSILHIPTTKKSLFIGFSKSFLGNEDTTVVQKRTDGNSLHIRSILTMHHFLLQNKPFTLNYEAKYYPETNHNTVHRKAEWDGIKHLLYSYKN